MEQNTERVRRLHIGGAQAKAGWEILDAQAGAHVDHVGDAADLSRFADATFAMLYASHVLEHFDFRDEIPQVLAEWYRVLRPGGLLHVSVPDLERLCHLYLTPNLPPVVRTDLMHMMFGGHADHYDYHMVGLDQDSLDGYLQAAGFVAVRRVWDGFGLFQDSSVLRMLGAPVSLNMTAERPGGG